MNTGATTQQAAPRLSGQVRDSHDSRMLRKSKYTFAYFWSNHPFKLHLLLSIITYVLILGWGYYRKWEHPPLSAVILLVIIWIIYGLIVLGSSCPDCIFGWMLLFESF